MHSDVISTQWTATIQTNQKALDRNDRMSIAEANKSLRAFVLPTEKAAVALARAWTVSTVKGVLICFSSTQSWGANPVPSSNLFSQLATENERKRAGVSHLQLSLRSSAPSLSLSKLRSCDLQGVFGNLALKDDPRHL